MQLPQISIRRPVLTVMMSLALVLFGAIGLVRLPVRERPNIETNPARTSSIDLVTPNR